MANSQDGPFGRISAGLLSSDAEVEAVARIKQGVRVKLQDILDLVETVEFHRPSCKPTMIVAFVKLQSGFVVVGESAPADPANFDQELGERMAKEDAIRKLWVLEGYRLRHDMHLLNNAGDDLD